MENQSQKLTLFKGQDAQPKTLKINQQFAEKFQRKKEREQVDKIKAKYGDDYENIMQEELDESSDSQEDENGDLINDCITSKFIGTLAKLRCKHPDIYNDQNQEIFKESDFSDQEEVNRGSDKKVTYSKIKREQIKKNIKNNEALSDSENSDQENQIVEDLPPEQVQQALKKAFKKAAETTQQSSDLLVKKKKSLKQIQNENTAYKDFIKQAKKSQPKEEVEILQNFWGKEENLDDKEKFLRKFILTKGWIDRDNIEAEYDSNDDKQEENADEFEEKYNFRYEEPGGTQLVTYERELKDTVRQDNDKRKNQRLEKEERKKEEKQQLQNEITTLKKVKKDQLLQRLAKIQEVAGVDSERSKLILNQCEKEFNDNEFDKDMDAMFNDAYYDEEDSRPEQIKDQIDEYFDGKKKVSDETNKNENKLDDALERAIEVKPSIPILMRKNLKDDELKAIQSDNKIHLWWYCDGCNSGIKPTQFRWDCQQCEDYTLCKSCFQGGTHKETKHNLKKIAVPKDCEPPQDDDIYNIIQQFKLCTGCQFKLTEWSDHYVLGDTTTLFCEECYSKESFENRSEFTKVPASKVDYEELIEKNPSKLKEYIKDSNIQKLVDEYYDLDFEDVIAGGLKTKFKYTDVEPEDFGLTDDDYLYCDDRLLNSYISIKKLFPYREEKFKMKPAKMRAQLKLIRKSTKKNKKELFREERRINEIEGQIVEQSKKKKPVDIEDLQEKVTKMKQIARIPPNERNNKSIQFISIQKIAKIRYQEKEQVGLQIEKNQDTSNLNSSRLKSYGL